MIRPRTWIRQERPVWGCVFFLILVIQFASICYINFTQSELFLDFDSALSVRHAVEMWQELSILKGNFSYVSSLEIDCAAFVAAPIYLLTGSYSFSLGIVHLILGVFIIWIIFDLFASCKTGFWCACLAASLVLTPFSIGQLDYMNLLFISVGQYGFRVISVLLLLDLLIQKDCRRIKRIFLYLAFYAFVFTVSLSSGNYLLVMGIVPLLLNEGIRVIQMEKFTLRQPRYFTLLSGAFLAWLGAALLAHTGLIQDRSTLSVCTLHNCVDNFQGCIAGIFLLGGAAAKYDNVSALSLDGLAHTAKFLFCIVSMVLIPIYVFRNKLLRRAPLFQMVFLIAATNLLVLMVCNTRYAEDIFEYRYHIIWFVPMLLAAALGVSYFLADCQNRYLKNLTLPVCALFLLLTNIQGFIALRNTVNPSYQTSTAVIALAETYDTDTVIYCTDPAGSIAAHITGAIATDITSANISPIKEKDGRILGYASFNMDRPLEAADAISLGETNLLVIPEALFADLPAYIQNRYEEIGTVSDCLVYYTSHNPFDGRAGFPYNNETSYDYPYTFGFTAHNGIYTETGTLCSEDASAGMTLSARVTPYAPAIYDITLEYQVTESDAETAGTFQLTQGDANGPVIAQTDLVAGQTIVTLLNVNVTNAAVYDLRLICNKNTNVEITGISYHLVRK